jgi:SAM-dependent methyltransferase
MSDAAQLNPTGRFSGLADVYAKHRPDYPAAAVEHIIRQCGLTGDALLVDVGCGTGISTRQIAAHGLQVIGVEPNDAMRVRAEAEPGPATIRYVKGTAEATGLPDGCATAVVAAQAFHWFDAPKTLKEFHRLLRPGGWVALMWNERDECDLCTGAYGAVMRTGPDAAAVEGPRRGAGEALLHNPLYTDTHKVVFHHQQPLDEQGLLGRAFSASYAPREPQAAAVFADRLRMVFAHYQRDGKVVLRYETSVYYGRRQGA